MVKVMQETYRMVLATRTSSSQLIVPSSCSTNVSLVGDWNSSNQGDGKGHNGGEDGLELHGEWVVKEVSLW